jgi:eukaryotic-like serine/threonine-protein kinase
VTITTGAGLVYTIGQPIDQGGFALVFEGVDEFWNNVVLKVFKPSGRPFVEVQVQWAREQDLFRRLRHPNVVTIHDAFVCENLFYLALERAWGNLAAFVAQFGPLPEPTVRELARQLLFALHFVHQNGVVHKDVTIQNVLVFEGPQSRGPVFKISDFGISTDHLSPWGTMPAVDNRTYLLPEVLDIGFGASSVRSDLYHLGLVLLFALQGSLPLNATMSRTDIENAVRGGIPRQQAEQLGTAIGDFVAILLRRHADYRFPSALEAWRGLQQVP